MKSTINMMVRDEPFAVLGLLSIIDYADNALIYDTGSTDGTYENLQKIKEIYPEKISLNRVDLPDGQTWVYKDEEGVSKLSKEASIALGKLRRDMHEECSGEFVWLLDGDEVYYDILAGAIHEVIEKDLFGNLCVFPPFLDLHSNGKDVRLYHNMGRVFRKNATYVNGDFGFEMHYRKSRNNCINNWDNDSVIIAPNWTMPATVLHFESVVKPWRKEQKVEGKFQYKLPEVFYRHKEFVPFDKYEFLKEFYE